ncbi:MAG: glycosyltransferase family 2 protein [Erythrobacter sp.]
MGVLAIIPCLNEARHIEAVVRQMLAEPDIATLVVADGGSTDATRAIVDEMATLEPRLHVIENPHRIQSAGVNLAVRKFACDHAWILRIDAHCRYPAGYASLLLSAAQEHNADCVVVPMITSGSSAFQRAVAMAQNSILGTGGSPHRHVASGRFVDHGHHALMKRDLFTHVGGYCEAMACNEDAELDYRINQAGGRIWLEPAAAIVYTPRANVRALWKQYFRYGKGRAQTLRRHRLTPKVRQTLPLLVPVAGGLFLLGPIHWLFVIPLAIWLVACGVGGIAAARRVAKISSGLQVGLAAATMHAAWGCGFLTEWVFGTAHAQPRYGLRQT